MKRPNKEEYQLQKQPTIEYYQKEGWEAMTLFCVCSGIPITVMCEFLLEIEPENDIIKKKMKSAEDFYGYEEI